VDGLPNIVSLHRTGAPDFPQAAAAGPGEQDLLGFLSQLLQQMQPPPAAPAAANPEELAVKIAAAPQNAAAEDLAAGIAALLQENSPPGSDDKIMPAPGSGLAAQLSLQIQDQPPAATVNKDIYQKIAALLEENKNTPVPEPAEMLNKIIAPLQEQQQDATPDLDPALLRQLKDKAAQLPAAEGAISQDTPARFKADIIQLLTDKGLDPPGIEHYLAALAGFLKQGGAGKEPEPADAAAAVQPAVQQPPAVSPAPTNDDAPRPAPGTPPAQMPVNAARDNTPSETPKPDAAQRATTPSLGQKDDAAPPPAPAPQQTLSAKIAGLHVNPDIISALAHAGSGFSPDDFGAESRGQPQDMTGAAAFLKPATVDALNTQNFTNYLAAARNLPNAVTQMVNIQLQRNISAKINTMTLQLHPADLGEMDIKLKFEKDGSVKAHLSVEKPETLALLQKDSYYLERVLQQNGIKIDENSLSFDLRQQRQQHNLEGFNGGRKNDTDGFSGRLDGAAAEQALQAKIAVQANGYITQSGVNIVV